MCAGPCDLHLGVLCWIRPLIDGGGREPRQGYSDDGLSEQVSRAPPLREPQRSRNHWGDEDFPTNDNIKKKKKKFFVMCVMS